MNKEIFKIIKEKNIHPIAYKKIGDGYFIKDKEKEYVLKLNTSNYDIYKYLISRSFNNFPENYNNVGDNYDLSLYIPNVKIKRDQKLNDLLEIMSILHKKTAYRREIDLDDIKEIYEDIIKIIDKKMKYYSEINDSSNNKDYKRQ